MLDALAAIRANNYVDDYLGSARTEAAGIEVAAEVRAALRSGDFHLGGWQSNSSAFVKT